MRLLTSYPYMDGVCELYEIEPGVLRYIHENTEARFYRDFKVLDYTQNTIAAELESTFLQQWKEVSLYVYENHQRDAQNVIFH